MGKYISLYEMSNLNPESTNVPYYTIWISTKSGREKHQARIKAKHNEDEATILIWGDPKVKGKTNLDLTGKKFKKLMQWVKLNQKALIRHWLGITDSAGLIKEIKKI